MRILRTLGVIGVVASVVVSVLSSPAAARGRVDAPWVVAATPTSMTLDWAGTGPYRLTARPQAGGRATSVRTRTSTGTVTGLRGGRAYCFTAARVGGAGRSREFCHRVPTRVRATPGLLLTVATYNICGTVCGRWPARRAAVLRRILDARVDVVGVQEASRRIPELAEALFAHGFDLVANTQNEAIFARRSVLHREAAAGPGCVRDVSVQKESSFPNWDKTRRHSLNGATFAWDESQQLWVATYVLCRKGHRTVTQRGFGTVVLPHGRTVAWATLLDVASGRHVTVTSSHLSPGGSSAAMAGRRREEAHVLQVKVQSRVASGPIVHLGDVNTSQARGRDSVGQVLGARGYGDAYQQSTSFTKAWMSSTNGFVSRPRREVRYGDHIDRIFVPVGTGVSDWEVVAPLRHGRNVRPVASDHHPVRATLHLP